MYEKLKRIRKQQKLNLSDMAELLEVTPSTYYKKEAGDTRFTLHEARIVADFFGYTIEELFFED